METASQFDSLVTDNEIFEAVFECREHSIKELSPSKPYVGMEFDSLHQAFLFYNEYAAVVGFSVRKDKTRKSNVDGACLFRRFCCSKEGFPRNCRDNLSEMERGIPAKMEMRIPPVPRLSRRVKIEMKRRAEVLQKMRVGCNARLDVKRTGEGKWVVQKFVEEHNHECVSLAETHLLRSHRSRQIAQGAVNGHEAVELQLSDGMRELSELNCVKPSVGMEFESHHKAFLFYNAYARVLGFVVRKDKTRKSNIDGSLLFRRFCCSKEGYRRKSSEADDSDRKQVKGGMVVKVKPRILPVTRVGCNAKLEVKKTNDGKWVVQKFIEEHNHEFDRFGDMQLLRSHKQTTDDQNEQAEKVTDLGTKPKKVVHMTRENGGNDKLGLSEQRLRSRIHKKRRKKLEKGDVQALFNYFRQMQTENPSFFYAVQVDDDDQMLNCFWADASSRLDFGYFGDVIYFEMNYGVNMYGRPFTPIFGVNQHLQTVSFGSAIILHETEESYVWLLRALLRAMHGNHPVTIVTDQDDDMARAIERVLPGTHHCLSLSYIFQNTAKNLSHLYNNEENFSAEFNMCVHESQTSDDFQSRWSLLLDKYELHDNEWLDNTYSKRSKWVPAYLKHIFLADMMTTQRNDGIHSFFNGFLSRSLPLSEFLCFYEKALLSNREKESYEDFKSHQTRHLLKSDLPMEKQAADIYSRSMFKEFHKEFCNSFNYVVVETETLDTTRTFMVSRWGQNRNFLVNLNSCDNDVRITCSCQNFEFMGILCMHALKVLTTTSTLLIPEAYLKKRWTKRAKHGIVLDKANEEMQAEYHNSLAFRYNHLCQLALNLSAKGAISLKAFQIAKASIEMKLRELEKVGEDDTIVTEFDVEGIRSSHPAVEVIKNGGNSKCLVTEENLTFSSVDEVALCDLPPAGTRGKLPKRIPHLSGENQRNKKTRSEPEPGNTLIPSLSSRIEAEPTDPCLLGEETQNHTRLLNMCSNMCMYTCPAPAPSGDLNDHYHSSDAPGFGEPFAGLSCIQTTEPNIFDLNQDVTVGNSSIPNSQTSHLDLNQVNHATRPPDSWFLPSSGWIKLNFCGISKDICLGSTRRRVAGFGGTISVSDGSIVKAYAGPAGEVQIVNAEILALWNGLKILSTLPSNSVWIEGNSEHVIKWLRRESDIPWSLTPMFFEIESIMTKLALGRITHVNSEGNTMAVKLASEGLTKDSLIIWDQMPSL
ncbi:hypothetical protein Sjap_010060 [Stephania japonica]|uniref:SWIM-type domain-containing protein n=1 Tax=Stephania japonica TaxID=461633 RepID=A0AAP0JAZ0_9MAGN